MASFMQIPEECLLIILARADLQSLCHVSATCQYMRTLFKVSNQINMHACIFKNVANCNAVGMLCSHASVISHAIYTPEVFTDGEVQPCHVTCIRPNTSRAA
jgi:fructose-bisphosphate aldolase class 1